MAVATLAASIFARFRSRAAAEPQGTPEADRAAHVPFSLDALRNAGL